MNKVRGFLFAGRFWRGGLRPLLGALLLLLLGLGSTAPASADLTVDGSNSSAAMPYIISGSVSGTIWVNSGGVLNIVDGAQISASGAGVYVNGGTVNVTGGSISSSGSAAYVVAFGMVTISAGSASGQFGVWVYGGTVSISGGSISADYYGVHLLGGTVSISGGSISGDYYGVADSGGTVSISGCGLRLSGGYLTGTLEDGTAISTNTIGLGPGSLISTAGLPQIACPSTVVVQAAAGACSASVNPGTAAAHDNCTSSLPVQGMRSDGQALTAPYPLGSTTITWTATNDVGSASCVQTVTVNGAAPPPVITLNGANPLTAECHSSFADPGATAADGCSGASLPVTTSGSVDVNTPGSYTLTYTTSGLSGGTATSTRTVNVVDTTPPVITLAGGNPLTVECHSSFTDPGATASDACAGSVAVTASGSVDPNTPGELHAHLHGERSFREQGDQDAHGQCGGHHAASDYPERGQRADGGVPWHLHRSRGDRE